MGTTFDTTGWMLAGMNRFWFTIWLLVWLSGVLGSLVASVACLPGTGYRTLHVDPTTSKIVESTVIPAGHDARYQFELSKGQRLLGDIHVTDLDGEPVTAKLLFKSGAVAIDPRKNTTKDGLREFYGSYHIDFMTQTDRDKYLSFLNPNDERIRLVIDLTVE